MFVALKSINLHYKLGNYGLLNAKTRYNHIILTLKKYENGTQEIVIDAYFAGEDYETLHFIL